MKIRFIVLTIAFAAATLVRADWSLVDDMEDGKKWTGSGSVVADPENPANQVYAVTNTGPLASAHQVIPAIANNTTGTLFFRIRTTAPAGRADWVWGSSPNSNPAPFNHFEGYGRIAEDGDVGNIDIDVRSTGLGGGFSHVGDAEGDVWYNIWLVLDNAADKTDLYFNTGHADATSPETKSFLGGDFRNGTNSALIRLLVANNESGTTGYVDDVYIDLTGENLTLPSIPGSEPSAVDDTVGTGVGGAIAFDPLVNDTGNIDPASLEIVAVPASGTAVWNAATGKIVYRHTGTTPGSDTFCYRISNSAGTETSGADVSVSVSGSLRLENVTLNVPAEPPSSSPGTLTLQNGLPGLTFSGAVAMTSVPGTPEALLIASIDGSVWYVPDSTAAAPTRHKVLDVSSRSNFTRGRSIYSIECFPDFAETGHIIVNYQGDKSRLPVPGPGQTVHDVMPNLDRNGSPNATIETDLRVSRFTLSAAHIADAVVNGMSNAENQAALATEYPYINLAEQHLFHSINDCKFGPDGYLYLTFGDEGDQGDPYRNGQRLTKDFYSAMLRIDIDPDSTNPKPNPHYAIAAGGGLDPSGKYEFYLSTGQSPNFRIPADNPFIHTSLGGAWDGDFNGMDLSGQLAQVRSEIWAFGLRNPFKFHLDVEDGTGETEAWIGDVGMDQREEFTILKKGENAGWSYYEGDIRAPGITHPMMPGGSTPHKEPLFVYPHTNGNNSATGGIFYRDGELSAFTGRYVCGDYGSGRIWSIGRDGSVIELTDLRMSSNLIVDFHLDPVTKDIFVLEHSGNGRVMRITVQHEEGEDYPPKLSDLGIFADLADLSPNPGVLPYEPKLAFWSDGAEKKRWFAIKNLEDRIGWSRDGNWSFPEGMVWIKHFDFDLDRTNPGVHRKRLETRVLVRNATGAYGVAYRWNEAGTEATLVANTGEDFGIDYTDENGEPAHLTWHIPSRAECMTCHTATGGHALSMNTRQFNLDQIIGTHSGNLLSLLAGGGYLEGLSEDPADLPRHHPPDESGADLEERVRSYLAVNCAYCHQPGGGAPDSWDGRPHLTLEETGILYGQPISEATPDLTDHLIRPGDKANSAIWNKINARATINGSFNGYSQMPPLATNAFDDAGIELIREWIDHHANVAPKPAAGSLGQTGVSENELVGYLLGLADAEDPDVRDGVADQSLLTYEIVAGNEERLFDIDPAMGALKVNGIIDYERKPQHVLTLRVSDNFAPNPGVLFHTVIVDLIDEADPDLTEDSDGNGIFDAWEAAFGLGSADPADNSDHDHLPLYFEFLAGGNPLAPDPPSVLELRGESTDAGYLLGWNLRNGFVLGEHYRVQSSEGLAAWTDLETEDYEFVSVTPVSPGVSRVVIRVPADAPRRFLRLRGP